MADQLACEARTVTLRDLPLETAYEPIEPGPLALLTPLIADCFANLECRVTDTGFAEKYNLFVLEVLKAWIDPAKKAPKTIHHRRFGRFAMDGRHIKLKSRMR